MSNFKNMDVKDFCESPFQIIGKDWMLVSAGNKDKVNTMTASWGGLGVMWGKNVAFVVIRESRYTKEFIDAADGFTLSFFQPENEGQKKALAYLGSVSGRDVDKIREAGLTATLHANSDCGEVPVFEEARMTLVCRKMFAGELSRESFLLPEIEETWYKDGDYHTLYVAEIKEILVP